MTEKKRQREEEMLQVNFAKCEEVMKCAREDQDGRLGIELNCESLEKVEKFQISRSD